VLVSTPLTRYTRFLTSYTPGRTLIAAPVGMNGPNSELYAPMLAVVSTRIPRIL
jgi:hypothetical protein